MISRHRREEKLREKRHSFPDFCDGKYLDIGATSREFILQMCTRVKKRSLHFNLFGNIVIGKIRKARYYL